MQKLFIIALLFVSGCATYGERPNQSLSVECGTESIDFTTPENTDASLMLKYEMKW